MTPSQCPLCQSLRVAEKITDLERQLTEIERAFARLEEKYKTLTTFKH